MTSQAGDRGFVLGEGASGVTPFRHATAIRDSKRPEDGAHVVPKDSFAAFLADIKAGRYDG